MQVTVQFPEAEFNAMLERFTAATGRSWRDVLRQQGRLLAVNLAFETQPYGDTKGRQQGEGAVMRDVGLVFASLAEAFLMVQEKNEKAARVFWRACQHGKWQLAQSILRSVGIDIPMGQAVDPAIHRGQLDRRGRVRSRKAPPAQIVINGKTIDRYVKLLKKRVGNGASGWAAVANDLGGMRGIPQWKKRGRKQGRAQDNSRSLNNPGILLENAVPYIGNLCNASAVKRATRMQKEKMEKHVEHVTRAAARKAGMRA